jgi:hypothetical protein
LLAYRVRHLLLDLPIWCYPCEQPSILFYLFFECVKGNYSPFHFFYLPVVSRNFDISTMLLIENSLSFLLFSLLASCCCQINILTGEFRVSVCSIGLSRTSHRPKESYKLLIFWTAPLNYDCIQSVLVFSCLAFWLYFFLTWNSCVNSQKVA